MSSRLNVLLMAVLTLAALVLVHTTYEVRRLYAALDKAKSQARALDVEYDRLKAEAQSQASPSRVERVARARLQMRPATPAVTEYLSVQRQPAGTGRP